MYKLWLNLQFWVFVSGAGVFTYLGTNSIWLAGGVAWLAALFVLLFVLPSDLDD